MKIVDRKELPVRQFVFVTRAGKLDSSPMPLPVLLLETDFNEQDVENIYVLGVDEAVFFDPTAPNDDGVLRVQ